MKIFEERGYIDGGPNDRGFTIGFIKSDKTREELCKERSHGFIDYHEVSEEEFLRRKKEAEAELKMFDI
jgi:hypothetical protein